MDDTPEDHEAVQPVISQISFYPLSEFDRKMKTVDWSKLPHFPAPPSKGETKWVFPEKFFDQLPQIMKEVPPLPGEEWLYKMFQSVLNAAAKDPKIKETLTQTAIAAEKDLTGPLFQFHNNGRPIGNGWSSPPDGARWGVDYLSRAASARSNMYDNAPEETRYIYTDFDSTGERLNGAHAYTVTFKNGEIPPVNGFWSLTLYNEEHFFSPNPLNRYSLGTKNQVPEVRRRWIAYALCPERISGRGQRIKLVTSAQRRRLLSIHPGVLAQGSDLRRYVDTANRRKREKHGCANLAFR